MTRPAPTGHYAEVGARLRMTEGSLRIAMHRLRIRFGELLRGEVAQTVADPADVDDELRDVIKSWLEG